jgi:hypothetical protein
VTYQGVTHHITYHYTPAGGTGNGVALVPVRGQNAV